MEKFIALIAVLMLLGLMTNAKSKFEAMSPGFDGKSNYCYYS